MNQTNPMFNQLSMPYLRAFVGLVLLGLTLYATVGFLSQGFGGLAFMGIVAFCIAMEIIKILFAGDVGFYLALKMPEKALFSVLVVLILSCLAIGSETWFLMSGGLKEATAVEQSGERVAALQSQVDDKKAQLAACNPSHLSKCVTPRTAELTALQESLDKAILDGAANSEAIASEKFWKQIADATGTTAANLHLGVNVMRSVLCELLGVYLFGQFGTWKRLQNMEQSAGGYAPMERVEKTVYAPEPKMVAAPKPAATPAAVAEPKPRPTARPAARPAVPSRQQLILNHVDTLRGEIAKRDALLAQHRKPVAAAAPEATIPAGSVDDKLDALFGSESDSSDSDSVKE